MPDFQVFHEVIYSFLNHALFCSQSLLANLWARCSVTAVSIDLNGLHRVDHYLNNGDSTVA